MKLIGNNSETLKQSYIDLIDSLIFDYKYKIELLRHTTQPCPVLIFSQIHYYKERIETLQNTKQNIKLGGIL